MNIAITGHSKGIGKALLEELSNRNHVVIGFPSPSVLQTDASTRLA